MVAYRMRTFRNREHDNALCVCPKEVPHLDKGD